MAEVENEIKFVASLDTTALEEALKKAQAGLKGTGDEAKTTSSKLKGTAKATETNVTSMKALATVLRSIGLRRFSARIEGANKVATNLGLSIKATTALFAALGAVIAGLIIKSMNDLAISAGKTRQEFRDLNLITLEQSQAISAAEKSVKTLGRAWELAASNQASSLSVAIQRINMGLFVLLEQTLAVTSGEGLLSLQEIADRWTKISESIGQSTKPLKDVLTQAQVLADAQAQFDARMARAKSAQDLAGKSTITQLKGRISLEKELGAIRVAEAQRLLKNNKEASQKAKLFNDIELARQEMNGRVLTAEAALVAEFIRLAKEEADEKLRLMARLEKARLRNMDKAAKDREREFKLLNKDNAKRLKAAKDLADQMNKLDADRIQRKKDAEESAALAGAALAVSGLQAFQDLAGDNLGLSKALGTAEVAINTAVGVANVWSKFGEFPPLAAALSAGVVAVGAAQIAAINATNLGGSNNVSSAAGFDRAEAPDEGPSRPAGDLGGGGTFIVLGNEVFDAQTRRALRRDSELDRAIRRRGGSQGRLGNAGDS